MADINENGTTLYEHEFRQAQSWKLKVAFMGCDNSNW